MSRILKELSQKIGYFFQNTDLLKVALTHRSHGPNNNERFEFLGDSLLNFFIAETLFSQYSHMTEGQLSRLRANLVNGEVLAELAENLEISGYLRLGPGEIKNGGIQRKSILSDSLEALIGAIYLDSDINTCKASVLSWFSDKIAAVAAKGVKKDPKTVLQEYLQSKKISLPKYKTISTSGKEHLQVFEVECSVLGFNHRTLGKGTSRRKAEQAAAEQFLTYINTHEK